MADASDSHKGYKPPENFVEDKRDPLVGITLNDSSELWLMQWQTNQLQPNDFQGKELTLKLNRDGKIGCLESSSGKSYEFVSFQAQEPDANVIIASASESKVVGKISRRVSLVHYPEPSELEKLANVGITRSPGSTGKSLPYLKSASKTGRTKSSGFILGEILPDMATPGSSKQRDSGMQSGTSFEGGALRTHSSVKQSSSRDQSTRGSDWSFLSPVGTSSEHSVGGSKLKKVKLEQ